MMSRVSLPNNNKTYRFGFNGEMMDDDVKGLGNQIAFNFRIHDPRVGRFLSVDPIDEQYPGVSPYAFAHNKVNFGNEQEGLEILDGFFKYNQWAFNKLGLGDTWVNDLNNSLYNRFSVEGRINQVTTAVTTEVQQIKKNPGQYVLKKLAEVDPIVGPLKRSIETGETIKRVGSGIIHGNTDAIAEGVEIAVMFYAGYKAGTAKLPKLTEPLPSLSKTGSAASSGFKSITDLGLKDGMKATSSKILNDAQAFLGEGYTEPIAGSGRYVSADGTRVFRMGTSDITGAHGGGPHVNFETLVPNAAKPGKMKVGQNIHVYLDGN
jgi:RHS repeat-associated protein